MNYRTKKADLETTRLTLGSQARMSNSPFARTSSLTGGSHYDSDTTSSPSTMTSSGTHKKEVDIWSLLKKADTWKKLLATGGGWLIYDIAYCKFYSVFSYVIFEKHLTICFLVP